MKPLSYADTGKEPNMATLMSPTVTPVNEPTYTIETLTPAKAKEYLDGQAANRGISSSRVSMYARDIENGDWYFNGAPIRFNKQGRLIDGQHRCKAVIKANKSIQIMVIRGIDQEAQTTMDTGRSRGISDVLALRGVKNASIVAAFAKRYNTLLHKGLERTLQEGGGASITSVSELLALFNDNEALITECAKAGSKYSKKLPVNLSRAVVGVLYFSFCCMADEPSVDYFFNRLSSGVDLSVDDPIYVLREKLQKLLKMSKTGSLRGQLTYASAITILAWNAYAAGKRIRTLNWRADAQAGMNFPTPEPVIDSEPHFVFCTGADRYEFLKNGIQLQPGTFGEYPHVNPKEETYGE